MTRKTGVAVPVPHLGHQTTRVLQDVAIVAITLFLASLILFTLFGPLLTA